MLIRYTFLRISIQIRNENTLYTHGSEKMRSDYHTYFNMIKYRRLPFTFAHAIVIIHGSNGSQRRLELKDNRNSQIFSVCMVS